MQRCCPWHSCYSACLRSTDTRSFPHAITLQSSAMSISSTRAFIVYLLSGFSVAVLSALFLTQTNEYHNKAPYLSLPLNSLPPDSRYGSATDKIWPVRLFPSHTSFSRYVFSPNINAWFVCFVCAGIEG